MSAPRVKNKTAAAVQITAEQLLREAYERQDVRPTRPPPAILDLEELQEYQGRQRKDFENKLRRNRLRMGEWVRYANWELEQKEFARARNVFERGLNEDPQCISLWLAYIDAEIKHRNINMTRNLLNRAIGTLPRVDKFWYKFIYLEETLSNIPGVRQLFERWMAWEPDEEAWNAYSKMEIRYGEISRARAIFERFVQIHPTAANYLKWARFEEENADAENVREVFSTAMEVIEDERIYVAFARFETSLKEYERTRTIYKHALNRLPRSESLYQAYSTFEKQCGDTDSILIGKRKIQYEDQIAENPKDYDAWFDYARLEEMAGDPERIREVYERAIAQIPPTREKRHWRRYIYLWINYAMYEEFNKKHDRARQIYHTALKLIPHKSFTFAKLWLLAAQFEVRQLQLSSARKLLGQALGQCPKTKLFKGYIDLEMQLREFDRCRKLYQKFLEYNPTSSYAWISYAGLERLLDDVDRVRAIFEFAITQNLDVPESVWKAYIDFEVDEGRYDRATSLYEKLLEKTNHVKVWISFAEFQVSISEENELVTRGRAVFERAYRSLKGLDVRNFSHRTECQRMMLLEAWKQFEVEYGDENTVAKVDKMMPTVVKKRRRLEDGTFEEYFDYLFKDDDAQKTLSLLQKAEEWRKSQANS